MGGRRGLILPLAALLAFVGALGVLLGLRAAPPGETEIIEAVAAGYVAETGGARTDCFARPSALPGVRMVVICAPEGGRARAYPVDRLGRAVEIDADALEAELGT
ncbi:hypothetical protein roselon_00206 [Roseibacterium elongatum DSM 19469]|uniref:Uncharacterized protein n=1 Tax=Roseicyclus elongatus DSM 19469 TaxID=1294273 RepID=W8RNT0_9RHOB|nr:hypothetical protein [Roseibacterium elongatum]AHM02663.1 hypothetical protein roselon_00206 [Roseibacterium elongatum DSM 19469]